MQFVYRFQYVYLTLLTVESSENPCFFPITVTEHIQHEQCFKSIVCLFGD